MWHHDDMRIVSSLLVLAFSACIPPPPGGGGPGADGGIDDVDGGVDADGVDAVFTWQEVSGTVCANGTPAGFGLSAVDDGSDTLVIFFNGGGACWDNVSCFGVNAASHVSTTYTADVMRNDLAPLLASGLIDRNTDTPFANAHLAFIPYCTADLHAGRADRQYQADLLGLDIRTVHHRGKDNVVADVAALKARFPDVSRVLVMGASAGGFGAVLNLDTIAAAFPAAELHVLADGAPFVQPLNGLYGTWRTQWALDFDDACVDCGTNFTKVWQDARTRYVDSRFSLLTSLNDETIRLYFGYGLQDITPQVNVLVDGDVAADNVNAFVVNGVQHVLLVNYATMKAADGLSLKTFVDSWATGAADWRTTRP